MPVLQKVYKKAKNIAKISDFEWYSVVLHTMSMQNITESDCSMSIWNTAVGDEDAFDHHASRFYGDA